MLQVQDRPGGLLVGTHGGPGRISARDGHLRQQRDPLQRRPDAAGERADRRHVHGMQAQVLLVSSIFAQAEEVLGLLMFFFFADSPSPRMR